jgi:hypothetical protein
MEMEGGRMSGEVEEDGGTVKTGGRGSRGMGQRKVQ